MVLPAFYNTRNTDVSFRVKYMLDDFDSQRGVFFFHPQYLLNVQHFWAVQGVRAKRLSSGLMLVTAALEMCEEVHLYGFWAFPMNPSGIFITHHYYDNVKPRPGFHAMPHEIFNFIHMHTRGIINVHTGPCTWSLTLIWKLNNLPLTCLFQASLPVILVIETILSLFKKRVFLWRIHCALTISTTHWRLLALTDNILLL